MADFCKECSIDHFGKDYGELAGLVTKEQWELGNAACVICEGCGFIQVDPEGNCIGDNCLNKHKKIWTPNMTEEDIKKCLADEEKRAKEKEDGK